LRLTSYKAYRAAMDSAREAFAREDYDSCQAFLERAHIIGQRYTSTHFPTHYWMLRVAIARGDRRAFWGQVLRLFLVPGALIGLYARGNPGGSDAPIFAKRPIPEDLREQVG